METMKKVKFWIKLVLARTSSTIENVYLVECLKHNLLSISQLCDVNKRVLFESSNCLIKDGDTNEVLFCERRIDNVYVVTTNDLDDFKVAYLSVIDDQTSF